MKLTGNGGFTCHHCGTELATTNHQWFIECDRCGSDDITNVTSFDVNDREEWEAKQRAHWEAEEDERAWEDEHAGHIEHEREHGAAARRASYRETVGRLP